MGTGFAYSVQSITLIWGVTSMTIGDLTDGVIVYGVAHMIFALVGIVLLIVHGDEFWIAYRAYDPNPDRIRGSFATD